MLVSYNCYIIYNLSDSKNVKRFRVFPITESCCLLRLSTNVKPLPAKVTFAESAADGQNKENDQPAVEDDSVTETDEKLTAPQPPPQTQQQVSNNNSKDSDSDDGLAKIIPWRAQLRKTNSTLNLLE